MLQIISILIFFFDYNWNNSFDAGDKIVDLWNQNYIYCITSDTKEAKPCWYLVDDNNALINKASSMLSKDSKDIFYSQEYFSRNKKDKIGNLYLWYKDNKYIISNNNNLKFDEYYYITNTPDNESNIIKNIIYNVSWIWILIIIWWLILFPKKNIEKWAKK